jgi:rhodanese-related sulfurtransferase
LGVVDNSLHVPVSTDSHAFELAPRSSGPLCGVYAVSRALSICGFDQPTEPLVKARFVSQCGGSTADDIREMIKYGGGTATARGNLSLFDLLLIGQPLIANVRRSPSDQRFNHWIVVVPKENGLLLYDSTDGGRTVSYGSFLGVWSGAGVFVSKGDSGIGLLLWLGRLAIFLSSCIILAFLLACSHRFVSRFPDQRPILEGAAVFVMTAVLSVLGGAVFGSFRAHTDGVRMALGHTNGEPGQISLEDMLAERASKDVVLVDARYHSDFKQGSIPGSISLTVDTSIWELEERLRKTPRDTRILVFCESKSCEFDRRVARNLQVLGFPNVAVSDGGWREYRHTK